MRSTIDRPDRTSLQHGTDHLLGTQSNQRKNRPLCFETIQLVDGRIVGLRAKTERSAGGDGVNQPLQVAAVIPKITRYNNTIFFRELLACSGLSAYSSTYRHSWQVIFFTKAIRVHVRGDRSLLPHFGHFPLFTCSPLQHVGDDNPPGASKETETGFHQY